MQFPALVVFAVAAIGGLILALHVLRDRFAPWPLSLLHAALGAAGLVLLLLAVLREAVSSFAVWSLVILLVAALGGFFLASFHVRSKLPPKGVVVLHAALAVTGFGLLAAAVFAAG